MLIGMVLINPPSHILFLFLKIEWGNLENQMRLFDSMKPFVSSMSWVNIYVVDLAPVDSPIGVLVIKVVIASNKPHDALTKLICFFLQKLQKLVKI